MNRVLIDTNAYAALMAGDERIADELVRREAILLSPIVLGELYDGFLNGTRNRENRAILARFREKPRTLSVPITERHRRVVCRDQAHAQEKRQPHSHQRRLDRRKLLGARRPAHLLRRAFFHDRRPAPLGSLTNRQ